MKDNNTVQCDKRMLRTWVQEKLKLPIFLTMMEPLIGLQGNTYVDGILTDDLTWELDCCTELVYTVHIEEMN